MIQSYAYQTNSSGLRGNVGVPNLGIKLHLGRFKRILPWNVNIDLKYAPFVGSTFWSLYRSLEVPWIVRVDGNGLHPRSSIILSNFREFLWQASSSRRHCRSNEYLNQATKGERQRQQRMNQSRTSFLQFQWCNNRRLHVLMWLFAFLL